MNKIFNTLLIFLVGLAVSFNTNAQTINYDIDMYDAFGDGWDSQYTYTSYLRVYVNGTMVLETTGPATGSGPYTESFTAQDGDLCEVWYQDGSFDSEHSFTITDADSGLPIGSWNMGNFDGNDQQEELVHSWTATYIDPASVCNHNFNLFDSWGDGWNGNTISVLVNGALYTTLTLPSGSAGSYGVGIPDAVDVDIVYNAIGSFTSEPSYTVTDDFGVQLAAAGPGMANGNTQSFVADCPIPCGIALASTPQLNWTLDPGLCEAIINFDIEITGDCNFLDETLQEGFEGLLDPENQTAVSPDNTCAVEWGPDYVAIQTIDPAAFGGSGENDCTFFGQGVEWILPQTGVFQVDYSVVNNSATTLYDFWGWAVNADFANSLLSIPFLQGAINEEDNTDGASGTISFPVQAGDAFALATYESSFLALFSIDPGALTVTLTNPSYVTVETLEPGTIINVNALVPVGDNQVVEYCLTDIDGVEHCVEFTVNVEPYPTPTTTLACNDYVQVSLDNNCEAVVGADMILEGGPYGCYEDYLVEVLGINDGNPMPYVSVPAGFYEVGVWDEYGNNCWGTMEVLDKIPPQILCETCPPGGLIQPGDPISSLEGELSADDPQGTIVPCWVVDFTPAAGNHPIDVIPFAVDADGTYDLVVTSSWGDGEMAIYDGPVNFGDLCENWIAGANDAGGPGFDPGVFGVSLNAGQTYYLAVSNYVSSQLGTYTVALSGQPGNFIHMGLPIYSEECTFYGCNNPADNNFFPVPEVLENCNYTVTYVDEEIPGDVCGSKFLRRTFTVTDGAGMSASCVQEYLFTGINLDELTWPLHWDGLPGHNPMLECNIDEYPTLPNGNPDPSYTGYPEGYDDYCQTIEVFFNDVNYTSNCGPKILREWTVIDDCTAEIFTYTQIIRITDTTPPTFMLPDGMVANTKGYVCNADFEIPAIMHLEDACDAYPQWYATTDAGFIVGDDNFNGFVDANETWHVLGVPVGTYELCYTAVDWCGNYYTECTTLTVEDDVPPIPVCEQYKQVSLTPLGDARVFAEDFDSGSFDNCGPVWFKVLRGHEYNNNNELVYDGGAPQLNGDDNPFTSANDVWFDDDVFFDCDDLEAENGVMVTLRVFDVDPGPGPISPYDMYNPNGRLYGRYNDCWTVVELECKIPPLVTAPDLEVSCEANIDPYVNTALYPDIVSVCGYEATYEDSDKQGDVCNGRIQRTWTVTGCGKTVTKTQYIYLTATEPFDPCTISFPADQTNIVCPDNTGDPGYPTWDENPCNIVTAEIVNIDTFKYVDGACYKVVVDWAVVDWCVYVPNTGAEDNLDEVRNRKLVCNELVEDGYYRYTQILMVTDIYAPEITVEDQCIATTSGCYAMDVELEAFATDTCNVDEKFWWKYIVTNMDTWETVQYSYNYVPEPEQGRKGSRSKDNLDQTPNGKIAILDPLPIGNYRVEWTVGDGCGNATSTYQYFTVADKKPPTPFLVDISTALMQNGMVEMTARFFDKGACNDQCLASFDDCSDVIWFTFTNVAPIITRPDWFDAERGVYYFNPETGAQLSVSAGRTAYFAGTAHSFDPFLNTAGKVFLCSDAPAVNVDVYVWDNPVNWEEGDCDDANYDFATVLLNLNDDGDCPDEDEFVVSGMVTANNSGEGIDAVNVTIDNETSLEYPKEMNTVLGAYSFGVENGDYNLTPTKRDDYSNGVTTLDLVLIQKHLLGLVPLTGDDLIAADANASSSVSAADLFELRELILGVKDELANNDSWVFVPGSQDVTVNEDVAVNFGGIKVGDVNGSAAANMNSVSIETRSANAINLVVDEAAVEAGMIEVPVTAENFANVYGGQLTLNVNGLAYAGVEAGALNVNNNNFGLVRDGIITMSWNNAEGTTVADGTVLFTLKFEAAKKGSLSSMISSSSDVTVAEAYTEGLEINGLNVTFRGAETVAFELFQNEPNPFVEETVIGFNLAEAGNYTLTVFDVTGKVVKVITGEGQKGYNSEELNRSDISSGVMYYQLESGEYTATKKMIIIE